MHAPRLGGCRSYDLNAAPSTLEAALKSPKGTASPHKAELAVCIFTIVICLLPKHLSVDSPAGSRQSISPQIWAGGKNMSPMDRLCLLIHGLSLCRPSLQGCRTGYLLLVAGGSGIPYSLSPLAPPGRSYTVSLPTSGTSGSGQPCSQLRWEPSLYTVGKKTTSLPLSSSP